MSPPSSVTQPRFPILIPSKSRAATASTPRFLDEINVPYRIIVEAEQYADYRAFFPAAKLITLDAAYQEAYDTLDELGDSKSRGPGPARNQAWQIAIDEGYDYHWVMDDNIKVFARLHENQRIPVGDGLTLHAMETFTLRFANVGMSGPNYWMFAPSRQPKASPFTTGTRIYSCNLIRNSLPFRWRGRYNEDTILSLDLLKAGWNTILFNAFLQEKTPTQQMRGGNTEAFYAREGTLPKSRMLRDAHPDVTRVVWRFNRWHHHVNYKPFASLPLTLRDDYDPAEEPRYELKRVPRRTRRTAPGAKPPHRV